MSVDTLQPITSHLFNLHLYLGASLPKHLLSVLASTDIGEKIGSFASELKVRDLPAVFRGLRVLTCFARGRWSMCRCCVTLLSCPVSFNYWLVNCRQFSNFSSQLLTAVVPSRAEEQNRLWEDPCETQSWNCVQKIQFSLKFQFVVICCTNDTYHQQLCLGVLLAAWN